MKLLGVEAPIAALCYLYLVLLLTPLACADGGDQVGSCEGDACAGVRRDDARPPATIEAAVSPPTPMSAFDSKVTFVVKTLDRADCVEELLVSLRARYPSARVIVADDGPLSPAAQPDDASPRSTRSAASRAGAEFMRMPRDAGLSASRNALVDRVGTEYFALLDDDFVFTEDTRIEKLMEVLDKRDDLDIVSGGLFTTEIEFYDYAGMIGVEGDAIRMRYGDYGPVPGFGPECKKVDVVANFFLARTAVVKKLRWDDSLKLGEHQDFFLRAKFAGVGVATCNDVKVFHKQIQDPSPEYRRMRMREFYFLRQMLQKHNLKRLIIYSGAVYAHID
ncbi:glycosyltransferase family 2 protein [Pelomyxa schiedti]|nr:glycosyltransferase family 2 protein [Pelomyxa schiedti]